MSRSAHCTPLFSPSSGGAYTAQSTAMAAFDPRSTQALGTSRSPGPVYGAQCRTWFLCLRFEGPQIIPFSSRAVGTPRYCALHSSLERPLGFGVPRCASGHVHSCSRSPTFAPHVHLYPRVRTASSTAASALTQDPAAQRPFSVIQDPPFLLGAQRRNSFLC
jgi:hypothetical protein